MQRNWIHLLVIFANEKIILWSDNKKLKEVMLFLTTSKRCYVVGVHTSPREGLFVINFMPSTQGL